jgi:REP element-mobilizing transposase RayT
LLATAPVQPTHLHCLIDRYRQQAGSHSQKCASASWDLAATIKMRPGLVGAGLPAIWRAAAGNRPWRQARLKTVGGSLLATAPVQPTHLHCLIDRYRQQAGSHSQKCASASWELAATIKMRLGLVGAGLPAIWRAAAGNRPWRQARLKTVGGSLLATAPVQPTHLHCLINRYRQQAGSRSQKCASASWELAATIKMRPGELRPKCWTVALA